MATCSCRNLRVLELYSGVGGMHFALQESGALYEVIQAVDINPAACQVYRHNFPETLVTEGLIEGAVTLEKLERLFVDMILMSPPCQPFTRMGKQKDLTDKRTTSFTHLLSLLPQLTSAPQYILVENVKGFETSQARESLLKMLDECCYNYQEFMLTPLQFGIPNSRRRYYLIAKRKPLVFRFQTQPEIMVDIADCCREFLPHSNVAPQICSSCMKAAGDTQNSSCTVNSGLVKRDNSCCSKQCKGDDSGSLLPELPSERAVEQFSQTLRQQYDDDHKPFPHCQNIKNYMEENCKEYFSPFLLSDKDLRRFVIMDVVPPSARKTACFARRYGNFVEGGGSVVLMSQDAEIVQRGSELKKQLESRKCDTADKWDEDTMAVLRQLELRWFTPREMANLLCFPPHFSFPEGLSRKQKYKCLGNSLNVHVVSVLIRLMLMGDSKT